MTRTAIFSNNAERIELVYGSGRSQRIAELSDLYPHHINSNNFDEHAENLRDVEVIFSTWGMPTLDVSHLDKMPALKAVFYAAGSVQRFARPLLERGIMVVTSAEPIGQLVAEYASAQILLANKGFFRNTLSYDRAGATKNDALAGAGNYHQTVAILGAGAVGRAVISLLAHHRLNVIVWDPFMPKERAAELGVTKVDAIEDAFSRSITVSNHLADAPETRSLIGSDLLDRLPQGGAFINCGRGATVNEPELAEVFARRPDLTALLDVQSPEPPKPDSPLYALPNVWLTSHIAGSVGSEKLAIADWAIEQFIAWDKGDQPRGIVTEKMLDTMA